MCWLPHTHPIAEARSAMGQDFYSVPPGEGAGILLQGCFALPIILVYY